MQQVSAMTTWSHIENKKLTNIAAAKKNLDHVSPFLIYKCPGCPSFTCTCQEAVARLTLATRGVCYFCSNLIQLTYLYGEPQGLFFASKTIMMIMIIRRKPPPAAPATIIVCLFDLPADLSSLSTTVMDDETPEETALLVGEILSV